MAQPSSPSGGATPLKLLAIAVVVGAVAGAFAWTAGWFSPGRITPAEVVDNLAPPGGPAAGFRRNHAKGVCFTGTFDSNGAGSALSRATLFAAGRYPVTGRFNLAGPDPAGPDGAARVRGLSLRLQTPDRQEWRSAMINPPFFPFATPQDFYGQQVASARKDDPQAMKDFAAAHPSLRAFGAWAGSAPYASSYAQDRFNSLNSFVFTNAAGTPQTVRWSFVPAAELVPLSAAEIKQRDPDFLIQEMTARVAQAPQKWTMTVTLAEPGDPTADPSQAWPDARRKLDVGTLVVSRIEPQVDGPCRDINFDPTVLPPGMSTSDDPFPAARSAAYAVSYDRRSAESKDLPRTRSTGAPK